MALRAYMTFGSRKGLLAYLLLDELFRALNCCVR